MKPASKWMIASLGLLMTQFAFATEAESEDSSLVTRKAMNHRQVQKPPEPSLTMSKRSCMPATYNHPGRYYRKYHMSVNGSFLFWEAVQEGMELAISTSAADNIAGTNINNPDVASRFLLQDFKYKSGFKVGFEVDLAHDAWSIFVDFTRYRNQTTVNDPSPTNDGRDANFAKVWNTNPGFNPFGPLTAAFTIFDSTSLSSKWTLDVDLLDWGLTRPFYQGSRLIFSSFNGMRAQWITQSLDYSGLFNSSTQNSPQPVEVTASSNSWAIGPRIGILGKWLMGWGFRIQADAVGSILYTRYNTAQFHAKENVAAPPQEDRGAKYRDYNALRLVNEMNMGLGWGSYLGAATRHTNFQDHFDLLVTYDFNVFWNQNMMRQMKDLFTNNASVTPANLYLHGLKVKAQLDF